MIPKNVSRTIVYFKLHDFLSAVVLSLWDKLQPEADYVYGRSALGGSAPSKNKIDLKLLVPSLRRLGMMLDCVDRDWNMHGA
jgi:hypothetical protein